LNQRLGGRNGWEAAMQIGYALRDELTRHIDQPSDRALIEAIAQGEKHAMQLLYTRYNVRVFRFILGLTRDESQAEDLVSEVFLNVWRKAGQFESRSKVSTWLLAIARHKTYSAFGHRTDAQLDEHFAGTIEDPADGPESILDKKDRGAVLAHCLNRLSPAHREIIDLIYYHEKSIEEVAQITGIRGATVKTRMHYARKRMAELLKEAGIDRVCDA
jgi:RNA polymerase sigma-70 factor (ECF subfamily)